MTIESSLRRFSEEEGLTFLEYLAHELTIAIRMIPERIHDGEMDEIQCRNAMFWTNEALHNVVQMTRALRIRTEVWEPTGILEWIQMWIRWKHASTFVENSVERAIYVTESGRGSGFNEI